MTELFAALMADATLAQAVGWLVGVIGFLFALWRGWPVFRRAVVTLSQVVKLADTLSTLPGDMATIKHELQPNSGTSMKDGLTRTEAAVLTLTEGMAGLALTVAALDGRTAAVESQVVAVASQVDGVAAQARSLKASVYNTNRKLHSLADRT